MLPDPNDRPQASHDHRPRRRLLPVVVASLAVLLFIAVLGYTYAWRGRDSAGGPVPVIKAAEGPTKTKPDNPGGMDVPFQDKEIYSRLGREPAPAAGGRTVERLLPPPETPMPRPPVPESPPAIAAAPPAISAPEPAAAVPSPAPPAPAPAPPAVATKTAPAATAQTAAKVPPAPEPPRPQAQAAAAPPVSAPAAKGAYRVQLAALRTAEEANKEWERLRRAQPEILGKLSGSIVRADLGAKGVFYRIQAGPVGDEAGARDLCRRLSEKKVGCIVVRP